ncbi:prolyl 4-hydroxylase subunit alpha-1-like [Oppia nitens]|uniref:prolyl 4-hydroxylase subunit alpha-1-like n=1 Tax=Oppia nitens TaxID=1686743 RepID=UPI0023DC94C0|nr:prolyl 4-hydroxylase subunit alpha-1-like [Oppia nitens]
MVCPVLVGPAKWIATKWIDYEEQAFRIFILSLFVSLIHGFNINFTKLESTIIEESQWLQTVGKYITDEEHRLSQLKSKINELKQFNQLAVNDTDAYLSHPINIYLLIKRLATEWPQVDKLLDQPTQNQLRLRVNPIENNELTEAAKGLQNLVNTYNLDIQALASGSVKFWSESEDREITIQSSDDTHRLTAADCYLIGKQTLIEDYYESAIQWFKETIKRSDNDTTDNLFKSKLAKHMALAYHRLGDYNQSVNYMNKSKNLLLVDDYQSDTEFMFRQLFVDFMIQNKTNNKVVVKTNSNLLNNKTSNQLSETPQQQQTSDNFYKNVTKFLKISQQLCRGVKRMNRSVESRLRCRYLDTTNRSLLRLTRVKVEQLYDKPEIVVFHDIISDREIDLMKQLASRQMARLMIFSNSKLDIYGGRLAEGSWLDDFDHEVVDRFSRRIGAVTGVNMYDAEPYNVIKYGVGGYYVNHYDVSVFRPVTVEQYGLPYDRIATWITYLSDVQASGATVFPRLDVRVEPRKGSAVFWFNLKSSGLVDWDTQHSGCPVLAGPPKWIATKWIPFSVQQLHKPCLLDRHLLNYL